MNKNENFNDATRKLDIKLLERLIRETATAVDRTGARVMYQIPLKDEYADVCAHIFAKYGIKMEKYNSSLSENPVLKITFPDIDKLSESARNFLFSVNVEPRKLQAHLTKIMAEMNNDKGK